MSEKTLLDLALQGGSFGILCVLVLYWFPRIAREVRQDFKDLTQAAAAERANWYKQQDEQAKALQASLGALTNTVDQLRLATMTRRSPGRRDGGQSQADTHFDQVDRE